MQKHCVASSKMTQHHCAQPLQPRHRDAVVHLVPMLHGKMSRLRVHGVELATGVATAQHGLVIGTLGDGMREARHRGVAGNPWR